MSKITIHGTVDAEELLQCAIEIDLTTIELHKLSGIHIAPGESATFVVKNPGHITFTLKGVARG